MVMVMELIGVLIGAAFVTGILYGAYWIGGLWGLVFIGVVALILVGLRGVR